jgi:hypothetical protein
MRIRSTLDWFVQNVKGTIPDETVPIELERNREAAVELGAHNPPDLPLYLFRLGLRAGFSGDQPAAVPVFRRVNPYPHPVLKEIFYCEVAGSVLEAANVHALREKVARMLETLAPGKALPLAYFRVPEMDYSLPVYEEGGKIVCPVLAGPKLKARELATVRQQVFRYLLGAGYVTDESHIEIRVLRPSDLRLVPPAAIISCLDDPSIWFATVEGRSSEGLVIGLLGESTELKPEERTRAGFAPPSVPPAATDIGSLLRMVGNELVEAGRLSDPFQLHARQVRPEIWARTEQLTDDVGHRLACWLEGDEPTRLELPLRRTAAGELLTALDDQGICVLVAGDEPALAATVGRYLSGSGFLRWEDAVEVVSSGTGAAASPPDRLVSGAEIEFDHLEFRAAAREDAARAEALDKQKDEEEVGLP